MSTRIQQIAEELLGTCKSLSEAVDSDTLTQAECEELDSITVCCEMCGWWEPSENISDGVCDECREDEE